MTQESLQILLLAAHGTGEAVNSREAHGISLDFTLTSRVPWLTLVICCYFTAPVLLGLRLVAALMSSQRLAIVEGSWSYIAANVSLSFYCI